MGPHPAQNVEWPKEAEDKYERLEVLGKGSFGMVWMSKRTTPPDDEFDDEYVAVKNIHIKDEKGKVYAEREISILHEMRHPNIIRLIRAFPVHGTSRLVIMQLARGPNLHQVVIRRGALGLPLARLVSRQLVAAVSYMHGRAVIHRDIKPSNCILASNEVNPTEYYDWVHDDAIWSNGAEGNKAVAENRWRLMLVDFGFARALEQEEVTSQARHLRNSIIFESQSNNPPTLSQLNIPTSTVKEDPDEEAAEEEAGTGEDDDDDPNSEVDSVHQELLEQLAEKAAIGMGDSGEAEKAISGDEENGERVRESISLHIPEPEEPPPTPASRKSRKGHRSSIRQSTARLKVRSMSALGTKAFAAPEIRKKLRHKTPDDFDKANAAMTECVADYGMIVDSYSVGWTLRVVMTGVPPNFTISEYMQERENVFVMTKDDEENDIYYVDACCCFGRIEAIDVKIRDPAMFPPDATVLIAKMTEKNPEDRITVREAQKNPWISGSEGEKAYELPQGDVPSKHGDPVVPLECASKLSKLTVDYHMQ